MTYTEAARLYWLESERDEREAAAEHERRTKAEEIADWAEAQHPATVPTSIPEYIEYREALICAALEGMTERSAA